MSGWYKTGIKQAESACYWQGSFRRHRQTPPTRQSKEQALNNLLVLVAAAAIAAPAVSLAASEDAAPAVKVSYQGLNLASSEGAATLLARVDKAAMTACGAPASSLREYRDAVRRSDCHQRSMNRAVAQLNSPTVTAAYRNRGAQFAGD